jgi:NADP-dependent 3-hydroxy acid dehydrogenase YdfG
VRGCVARGASAEARPADVRDRVAMARALTQPADAPPIDLLIANAGVSAGMLGAPLHTHTHTWAWMNKERERERERQEHSFLPTYVRVCASRLADPISLCLSLSLSLSLMTGEECTAEDRARGVFATNVDGVFNSLFPLVETMRTRRSGQIAVVSSLSGTPPMRTHISTLSCTCTLACTYTSAVH